MRWQKAQLDRATACGLGLLALLALWATERAVGYTRDESVYFAAGESYARWWTVLTANPAQALSDASIVHFYGFNREHPVLMKTLFGLSHQLFHRQLGWVGAGTAFRIPALAAAALIPALLYAWGRRLFGRIAALFAALCFLLVPRHYFNAELACFDMPIAALWLLTVYAFWRAQETDWGWLACGVAFGVALGTKHNALFLPFTLAPFGAWAAWRETRDLPVARRQVWLIGAATLGFAAAYATWAAVLGLPRFQQTFGPLSVQALLPLAWAVGALGLLLRLRRESVPAFRALAPLWAMACVGPLLFYVHWPYLWHHPVDRTAWYLAFHARHNHYAWFYLGELLRRPPFPLAYVGVKTALTVPLPIFVPMVTGLGALLARLFWPGRRPAWGELLVGVNALASMAIISHPNVPHFGGVKHWLPSMPFLALLAGHAVSRALAPRPTRAWAQVATAGAAFAALLGPAVIGLLRIHPYGTSFYSEMAGGVPGAASLGMQRQFWSNNVTGVLPWINQSAPRGARLYLHEVNGYSFRDYQRNGQLRADLLPASGPRDADLAAYQYHQEFREQEFEIWNAFGTQRPVHGLYVDETPQVVVYRRTP
ncbi:MAG TPA: glycosyltransferase family 39 protein [Myxococcaceae bacterium]|nr:glycosyltransferase family 39 protein [Myxococcaceae bacterium]